MFAVRNGLRILKTPTTAVLWQGKIFESKNSFSEFLYFTNIISILSYISDRGFKRWVAPVLKQMKARKKKMAPQPITPRSAFIEFNYGSELFCFAKRLNEEFDRDLLQQAFTHKSYIIQEEMRQKEVGIEEPELKFTDNLELVIEGDQLIKNYVTLFLNYSYPKLPEIGINTILNYLTNEEMLAHVSSHIGTTDIILCAEIPPETATLASTLKAIVSALSRSSGDDRAFLFVRDFIVTQLNQKDINEIWDIQKPMELLKEICEDHKLGEPEPRSIGKSGKNTILACNRVGLYCKKQLISTGFGESVGTAIDCAALNALNKLFRTEEWSRPLNFRVTLNEAIDAYNKQKASRI